MLYKKSKTVDGKSVKTREGELWKSMMQRCKHTALHPSYVGCEVSEEFLDFQVFAKWCNEQFNYAYKDDKGHHYQLDKDLLTKNNGVYAESTCLFLPREVNMFLVKRNGARGGTPIGVCYKEKTGKYEANCNLGEGRQKYLGEFISPQEAFLVYKEFKESLAKVLALKYKGKISEAGFESLYNYVVDIND